MANWHRLTRPHAAVTRATDRRRARLGAGLLLVLIPLAAVFAGIYAYPVFLGRGVAQDGLSLGVLAAFIAAYALVRSQHFRYGILLLVLAPLAAILAPFATSGDPAALLYFTAVPILLAGLLLDLRFAAALAALNLAAAWLVAFGTPGAHPGDFLGPFLFLVAASSIALVGTGFFERSIHEAEESNEALRVSEAYRLRLLNTIVHDLSTPLTSLGLHVAMLENAVMQRNLDLLQRLVTDIADLAKIESDRLDIQVKPADLGSLARQAVQALQGRAEQEGVTLEVDAASVPVKVDPDRITQVFYNLLSNAIKFTPPGGQVALKVASHPSRAEARIQDTGRGLSPEEIQRLFQPFTQVHQRTEGKERGTGLGLFITKAIVEAHGGSAWVKSDGHGKGSTFGFSIPAQPN